MKKFLPVVLALALLPAPSALAGAWESPEFASAAMRPRRIAILPAHAEMVRTRVNDALPFVKETAALEDALRASAAAALKTAGYEPDLDALSPAKLAADRDLQALVRQLEAQVGQIVDVASGRPRDIGRGRFSVGEAVLPLARATGAEGFLWLQSQSVVPSKGQRTLGSIFSVLAGTYAVPSNRTQLIGFLVDARTGDLASVALAQAGGAVLKEPAQVAAKVTAELFQQWPAFAQARNVSAKRVAAEQAATKPEVPLEGVNVEELETIARFEDAVARLEGGVALGLPEEIGARDEFTDDGQAIAAEGAIPAEPVSLFESPGQPPKEPPPAASPSLPPREPATSPSPVSVGAAAPPPVASPGLPEPRQAWSAPAQPSTRQVVMQMLPGAPGVDVRNATAEPVTVSVDLGAWTEIGASQERSFEVGPGSHRILVATTGGAELTRANVLVSNARAKIEILR